LLNKGVFKTGAIMEIMIILTVVLLGVVAVNEILDH